MYSPGNGAVNGTERVPFLQNGNVTVFMPPTVWCLYTGIATFEDYAVTVGPETSKNTKNNAILKSPR